MDIHFAGGVPAILAVLALLVACIAAATARMGVPCAVVAVLLALSEMLS